MTDFLNDLYKSLDERRRPEDVLAKIGEETGWHRLPKIKASASWMFDGFHSPPGMAKQISTAETIFGTISNFSPHDVKEIENWIRELDKSIGKTYGQNDFKADRLSAAARKKAGITVSRRQYNKQFRTAVRLERKAYKLSREQFKRGLTLASKNRLGAKITREDFCSDVNTASLIAYFTARSNLRSVFTNTQQARAWDEVCEALLDRCRNQKTTNWFAIAHVNPTQEVLNHLTDEQKGNLLGLYYNLMLETANFLKELWTTNAINEYMVVSRGVDSTTWNVTAGAWNKLRDGWFNLVYSLGLTEVVDAMCPGKVLRLMAADVARWHSSSGGDLHVDTKIWKELPRPWEVLGGTAVCDRALVEKICRKHGVDVEKSAWTAPRPQGKIEKFSLTPDLVHGIAVSPEFVKVLKKAGAFSGKGGTGNLSVEGLEEAASAGLKHQKIQEQRRLELEK